MNNEELNKWIEELKAKGATVKTSTKTIKTDELNMDELPPDAQDFFSSGMKMASGFFGNDFFADFSSISTETFVEWECEYCGGKNREDQDKTQQTCEFCGASKTE